MTTNQPTAAKTYASHAGDIARLIDVLQIELGNHAEQTKAEPGNWAVVGDIAKVRNDLIEIVAFISSTQRSEIERFLAE